MLKSKNKAFTLIELIVVMAVIGVLVLLAMPKFMGNTKEAKFTKLISNSKQLENASERYYMDKQDWPRLTDEPYSSADITAFAKKIYDTTGKEATLDISGNYYDIDYSKLSQYINITDDKTNYIIQNPIGNVYALEGLTTTAETRNSNHKPTAIIRMTPSTALTTATNIIWDYSNSTDSDNDVIINSEWEGKQDTYIEGTYTVKLRVQDSIGSWSDWASKTFTVIKPQVVQGPMLSTHEQGLLLSVNGLYPLQGITSLNLFDKNKDTEWMSNSFAGWVNMTFDNPQILKQIKISTMCGQYMTASFYDNSGVLIYNDIYTIGTGNSFNSSYISHVANFNVKTAQPIKKIIISGNNSNGAYNYFNLNEIEFIQ